MTQGKLEIHSENILPIIKRWLYSDKDIFIRELISNACDAIQKVKILKSKGQANAKDEDFAIAVSIDKEKKTLTFSDTGIGMDAGEVKEYIAQIAFSGAEAFVEKYESHQEGDQFIGHFGLGFYSSYMVADRVEIQTLSYKEEAKPAHWECDGSPNYTLDEGTRKTRGTDIILHIGSESEEFLEETTLKAILKRYCTFLPYPITLNDQRINEKEPLWIKAPSECSDQDYLEFYRHLYPMQPDPLFWIHLNVDYPFHLQGILYFPKLQRNFDFNKSNIHLYCNRVFVSDNCKDLIPNYLMPLQGVIDSPDIPLNVSRSTLQMDRTVRQLGSHISKKVSDSLGSLHKTNHDRFLQCWSDIAFVIKLGAVEDDKFYERTKSLLLWKTSDDTWMTTEEYLETYGEKTDKKIFYSNDPRHQPQLIQILRDKQIGVITTDHPVDSYLINSIEKHTDAKFQRIDSDLIDHLVDPSREKSILDGDGKTEAGKLADFFRVHLKDDKIDVEAKSLAADTLPAFVKIDENERRMRDYMQMIDTENKGDFINKRTLIINTNSPLISAIEKIGAKDPVLSEEMVHEVYELALLSQREMAPDKLQSFIQRTSGILEKLAQKEGDRMKAEG